MKVLILEDEKPIRDLLCVNLKRAGFEVAESSTGEDALSIARDRKDLDIAILDLMLPGMSGFEVCTRLRALFPRLGIIMLTAKSQEVDKVMGLDSGADDYVVKPFSPVELVARVRSLYRRMYPGEVQLPGNNIELAPFTLMLDERKLLKNGQDIPLTPTEFMMVKLLMEQPNKAMNRDDILTAVWGQYFMGDLKIVDVNISRIRQKIGQEPTGPQFLETVSRLTVYITLVLLLIVLLLEGVFIAAVHYYYLGSAMETLNSRAATSATFFNKYLEGNTLSERARYILENLSPEESSKVEVLNPEGNVIINSFGFSSSEHVNTPDVRAALTSGKGTYQSLSPVNGERIMAVSIALKESGNTIGVLRYSVSAEPLYAVILRIVLNAAIVGLLVIGFGFVLSLVIAKRIVGPIQQLTGVAKEMATGNFTVRAERQYNDEVGTLAVTLNYMSEEILKSEKIKYDFISSVTHELRTPLTSIKGWGETLLVGDLSDKQETLQGLEVMTGETDRLIGLVEDLLDFSKFQAGEIKIVRQPYDLRGLLEDLLLQFRYRGQTKQIRLYADIPDQPLPVDGDFNRLKQVFVNLLDNAFKFTPAQGAISMTAELRGEKIIVTVTDNGEGIEAADLAQLGTKFFKGRSRQSGSGLGLAICKEIIELHGGRLRIESEFTKGTSVIVELPHYRLEQHLSPG
ncbi:hypothetical protein KC345_g10100 [Hortaea werneckii]|nr:hypothetical protein KC345_g10100 [Hortaea werneckii]